jgi:hypothetical protein
MIKECLCGKKMDMNPADLSFYQTLCVLCPKCGNPVYLSVKDVEELTRKGHDDGEGR